MPIVRANKRKKFTQIVNELSQNDNLSYGARGLMIKALSYPDDWKFSGEDFFTTELDKKTKIRGYLQELEQNGYLKRSKTRDNRGLVIGAKYTFYETPVSENLNLEKPILDNLNLENQKMDESIESREVTPSCENLNLDKPNLDYPNLENRKHNNTYNITNTYIDNIYSSSEDIYLDIFNYWNQMGVTKAVKLVVDIKRGIDNALRLNLSVEDIKKAILNYSNAYKQEIYKSQWRLVDFLNKKDRDNNKLLLMLFLDSSTSSNKSNVVELSKEAPKSRSNKLPYQEIFDLYVQQGIIKHNTLTDGMKNAIKKAAAKFTIDEIKLAIKRYGQMYRDKENQYAAQYCKYKWTLSELLTREKGISEFLDEGGKWIRYKDKADNKKQEVQQKRLEDFF